MKIRPRLLLAASLLGLGQSALAASPQQSAQQLIAQLQAGQFSAAEASFSTQMAQAVPAAKLAQLWQALNQQLGTLTSNPEGELSQVDGHQRVVSRLQFDKGALLATTVIDPQGRIAGFHLAPVTDPAPAVAADAPFSELSLQIIHGPGPLGATLSLPKGTGPFPGVVLVHGSGPQDRDESVGPNKPFADIARGLAAQGIAVLRYDKRTQARPQDFSHGVSLATETTDDAVAALALLKQQPQIDPSRMFVLGHSQGGMLAARIAKAGGAAGAVMFASPARPILDLLREQNVYLLQHSPEIPTAAATAHLQQLDAAIAALRSDPQAQLPALPGLPGSYWQELEAVEVVAETAASGLPVLLLQGGRDFQVSDRDWQLLNQGLQGPRYTFRHYPALNHLGIAGEGAGTLAEYQQPGKVAADLINDIVQWIHAR